MTKKRITSILTAICIIATCFTGIVPVSATLAPIAADSVSHAILKDAAGVVETVCTSNEVTATESEDVIAVTVSTKDLAKHTNGADVEGYWTGFAVVAPTGATQMKAALGTSADITLGSLIPVEENVTEDADGIAFYTDAGLAAAASYAKLQWFDASGNPVSAETTFVIDLSGVTLAIDYVPVVGEAKIQDKDNTTRVVYDAYTVETTEGNVIDVNMTGLVLHTNGVDAEGYWTGFAVTAPTGATQMKAALGTSADVTLGSLIPVEENVTEDADGIAFYTDVTVPKTYAKVQWFDAEGNALSNVTTFTMDLTDVEVCEIKAQDVSAAILVDAAGAVETLSTSNEVTATETEGVITVSVSTKDLAKHTNGADVEGYWTGFAVAAPAGATQMKAAFGTSADITLGSLIPVEENVTEDADGIAFYTDAGLAAAATYAKLQWFDAEGEAICQPATFEIDLSGVTLDIDYTPEITKAKVQDKDDTTRVIYDVYTVEMIEENVIDINMTELAEHTNGADAEGYWTGFAVVAPEGATQMKAALGTSADITLGGLIPVEENIATVEETEKSGVAFYVNAADETPKTYAKVQWFDAEGKAVSNVTAFTIDITDVKFNWVKADAVSSAILEDTAGAVETLSTSNEVTATETEGVITVSVSTKDLAKHTNGADVEGYWTGFAVVAPTGATQMKAALGTSADITLGSLIPVEENVTEDADGIAFYTDAGLAAAASYAKLQWFDASGNPVSAETTFIIDLSGVTLADMEAVTAASISEAKIVDQNAESVKPYDSYSISATEETGNINVAVQMTALKAHTNATGTSGHWTGFAITAPEGASQLKYVFDTAINADWSNAALTAVEADVVNDADGAAFYTDANAQEPKTVAMIQWFDAEGKALSNITTIVMDLSGVGIYRAPVYTGGGSGSSVYTVKFETNGGTAIDSVKVAKNKTITEPSAPKKEGYTFDGWYTDKGLSKKYDFSTKVTKSFTLYAKWTEADKDIDTTLGFADVYENAWYYDAVSTVVEKGLMNGISDTEFAPDMNLTRAMFVTILYRVEGEPEVSGTPEFGDIAEGKYYTDAVIWATANSIVSGMSDTEFMPDINITREQMATMIYRYAKAKGIDTAVNGDISYADSDDISEYAIDAVVWATNAGVLKGNDDGNFAPQRNATRAEAAAVFVRLLDVIA